MAKTTRGEQTRARILESALELFRERGYEGTTMRAVAEAAGVSLGNAYYYFASKEHLLQAYYGNIHEQHAAVAGPFLEQEKDLEKRLKGVLRAKLAVIEPYHRFSGLLFRTAADPKSPLNPFGEESAEARSKGIDLYRAVLDGVKLPPDIATELPELLWTYSMGIVLFWLHDDSAGRARTHALIDGSTELVVKIIRILSNPLLKPLRKSALEMLAAIRTTPS